MKLILIRHGEIHANVAKVYSGRSDETLNENGQAQAKIAAKKLRLHRIDALYTSPLRRAQQTAQIIGQAIGHEPIIDETFNELMMGPWEGLSEGEVARRYPNEFDVWNRNPANVFLEGRETLAALQYRVMTGLMKICGTRGGDCFAIVSHVAVIRTILLTAAERSLNEYKKIDVPNATPLIVELVLNRLANIRTAVSAKSA